MLDGLRAAGWTTTDSHRATFATLLALQAGGFGWFLWNRRHATGGAALASRTGAGKA